MRLWGAQIAFGFNANTEWKLEVSSRYFFLVVMPVKLIGKLDDFGAVRLKQTIYLVLQFADLYQSYESFKFASETLKPRGN